MSSTAEASALYDLPGPRARGRHRLYGFGALLGIAGLLAWLGYELVSTGQFSAAKWIPFQYVGIQELLWHGLLNTLRAFGLTVLLALPFGALFAAGRLSDHRVVRWASTLVVEFFRAMPLLVMIFFIFVAMRVQPLWALVAGLTLYNGSVLAEVFRAGVLAVPRGQREAAYALGLRKTQVMAYVLVPQANRAMLPSIVSQLVVALKDTSLGFLITYEEFLHAGKLIATNLDYDLPFIPVVMVIAPVYIGMCLLLSWLAGAIERHGRRSPRQ
ncbi:amino acid ABC transporter permease [Kitasatospora viridis]|uniref:Glutamate transport system permease protein n=1 Tax=Kitasatospora viridis TaxID=281105 RepID=A0A561UNY0_9ACTN|nr:amino acid ABC transporter permease [Kitasatospora viridis]TWG01044.1 glutamate transport system permease protein [Kitasatospora viridis]